MIKYIKVFLIFISLYFILHTVLVYGGFGISKTIVSFSKEILWFWFFIIVALKFSRSSIDFIKKYNLLFLAILGLILIGSIITFYQWGINNESIKNIIIWLKYGVLYMFIFYTALRIWYIFKNTIDQKDFIRWIYYFYLTILCAGFLVQLSKILFPQLWYDIWFRTIDIFRPEQAPPIYYLTNVDGFVRLSWLFSWPNNYWFWLVWVFAVLIWWRQLNIQVKHDIFSKIMYIVSALLNLGRSIWVGIIMQTILYIKKQNIFFRFKKTFYTIGVVAIIGLIYMTYHKRDSTLKHFDSTVNAFMKFLNNPRWYGLWSSWPGVYYNGFILPENYYLQAMIDFGIIGFLLILGFWVYIFRYSRKINNFFKSKDKDDVESNILTSDKMNYMYLSWFLGMCVVGLFLHVFEDSMVNYLIFVPWGIIMWSLMWRSNKLNQS